jgi:hypothetical protein
MKGRFMFDRFEMRVGREIDKKIWFYGVRRKGCVVEVVLDGWWLALSTISSL